MDPEIIELILALRSVPNTDIKRIIKNVYYTDFERIDKIKSIKRTTTLNNSRLIDIVNESIAQDEIQRKLEEKVAQINARKSSLMVPDKIVKRSIEEDEIQRKLEEKVAQINSRKSCIVKTQIIEDEMDNNTRKLYNVLMDYLKRYGKNITVIYSKTPIINYNWDCWKLYEDYKRECRYSIHKCIDLRLEYLEKCSNNMLDYSHLQHLVHMFRQYYRE